MADQTMTTDELLRGPAKIMIAAYGTEPTDECGYTKAPIKLSLSSDSEEDYVQEVLDPVDDILTKRGVKLTGNFAQLNVTNLSNVLGITATGGTIALGGDPEEKEVAVRVVASRKDRSPVHFIHPRMKSSKELDIELARGKSDGLPFSFKGLYSSGAKIILGSAVSAATIATGVATRVATGTAGTWITWVKLSGEGAAADALTSIAGTGLVDGELIRIQIASATMPITVTHGSNTLVMKTAANVVLTKTTEWIDFRYNLSGTKWEEIARYIAS